MFAGKRTSADCQSFASERAARQRIVAGIHTTNSSNDRNTQRKQARQKEEICMLHFAQRAVRRDDGPLLEVREHGACGRLHADLLFVAGLRVALHPPRAVHVARLLPGDQLHVPLGPSGHARRADLRVRHHAHGHLLGHCGEFDQLCDRLLRHLHRYSLVVGLPSDPVAGQLLQPPLGLLPVERREGQEVRAQPSDDDQSLLERVLHSPLAGHQRECAKAIPHAGALGARPAHGRGGGVAREGGRGRPAPARDVPLLPADGVDAQAAEEGPRAGQHLQSLVHDPRQGAAPNTSSTTSGLQELMKTREGLNNLLSQDFLSSVPLSYSQVAFLVPSIYFFLSLIGRQFVQTNDPSFLQQVDYYVPFYSLYEFVIYFGWLKVAQVSSLSCEGLTGLFVLGDAQSVRTGRRRFRDRLVHPAEFRREFFRRERERLLSVREPAARPDVRPDASFGGGRSGRDPAHEGVRLPPQPLQSDARARLRGTRWRRWSRRRTTDRPFGQATPSHSTVHLTTVQGEFKGGSSIRPLPAVPSPLPPPPAPPLPAPTPLTRRPVRPPLLPFVLLINRALQSVVTVEFGSPNVAPAGEPKTEGFDEKPTPGTQKKDVKPEGVLNFAMIIATALMIWKGLMVVTGSESPVVVVLSGSMEPSFYRGDLLILGDNHDDPITAGEIVVFRIKGRDIPVVHRVIRAFVDSPHDSQFLTKGDNNRVRSFLSFLCIPFVLQVDDRGLYAEGQNYVHRSEIIGRARGLIPYIGMVTILLNDYPQLKYVVIGILAVLVLIHREMLSEHLNTFPSIGVLFTYFLLQPKCARCPSCGRRVSSTSSPFPPPSGGTKIESNVLELSDRFLEIMDQGMWLVKLYAPWCAHCKRLAPVWEHVGHALADAEVGVRVAKVDCTRFPAVSSKLRVSAYPTIIFFRNGVQIPYEGERRKEALVEFAVKSAGPIIGNIESTTKMAELRKSAEKDPLFIFVDGETPDQGLFEEYDNVSGKLFTETRFFRSPRTLLPAIVALKETPDVVVLKDNTFLSFKQQGGDHSLSDWIRVERWPLLPPITSSNVHSIAEDTNKMLVLALVDMVERTNMSTDSGRFFKLFKEAAISAEKDADLRSRFQFGWMDGNSIANSVVMGEMPVPGLFVFNVSSYEFFLLDDQPEKMTAPSILAGLRPILSGVSQPLGGRSWPQRFRRMGYEITKNLYDMFYHQPILTMCLFGVPLAFFSIIAYSVCSSDFSVDRDEIYPTDEEDEDEEEDDGEEVEIEGERTDDEQSALRNRRRSYATGSESEGEAEAENSQHPKAE
ncbi:Disulfide-isomerase A4 [Aphelenchoides fujianensis]|nr:Disulfide-isomerase A4 [Aphelenchoides fujianensis]